MNTESARRLLHQERDRLLAVAGAAQRLTTLDEVPSTSADAPDQAATESSSTDVQTEIERNVADQMDTELAEVDAALERLDGGSYGFCERCGEPIDDARLEALPAARLCVRDQAETERLR
jgi:DnaK suppressor protein